MRKWIYNLIIIVINLLVVQSIIAQSNQSGISIVGALSESKINESGFNYNASFILGGQAGLNFSVAHFSESMCLKIEINGSIQGTKWEEESIIYDPYGLPVNADIRDLTAHPGTGFFSRFYYFVLSGGEVYPDSLRVSKTRREDLLCPAKHSESEL